MKAKERIRNVVRKTVEAIQLGMGIVALIFIVLVLGYIFTHRAFAQAPFEGNPLPGWDCQTPMALSSGALPNTVLIAYRTSRGEWLYRQFAQGGMKSGRPFYSEVCPQGVLPMPIPPNN